MKNSINNFNLSIIISSYTWLILFVLFPFLIILGISLSEEEFGRLPFKFFIDLENGHFKLNPNFSHFFNILTEPMYYNSLFTSLRLAMISTFFCFVIGYPIAYSIFTLPAKLKTPFLLMIMIPL